MDLRKPVEGTECRELHNGELHDCRYFSPNIILMIACDEMRMGTHHVGDMRNENKKGFSSLIDEYFIAYLTLVDESTVLSPIAG